SLALTTASFMESSSREFADTRKKSAENMRIYDRLTAHSTSSGKLIEFLNSPQSNLKANASYFLNNPKTMPKSNEQISAMLSDPKQHAELQAIWSELAKPRDWSLLVAMRDYPDKTYQAAYAQIVSMLRSKDSVDRNNARNLFDLRNLELTEIAPSRN